MDQKINQKFLIDPPCGRTCRIKGQDAKHMSKILRADVGDTLSLTDGTGMDYTGKITAIDKTCVEVELMDHNPSSTESPLELTLCSGMLKHQKMDTLIKELVQLGVTRWVPFTCRYAVPVPDEKRMAKRMDRWRTIVRESLKQCRRSKLMEVSPVVSFETLLQEAVGHTHCIAFWEKSGTPLSRLTPSPSGKNRAIVLVGPEGGFSSHEIDKAREAGFSSYGLGPRILRAETAALTAAALVQHFLGDI